MKKTFYIILGLLLGLGVTAYGATVFRSDQVGSTPINGYILQTDGTNSSWVPFTGGGSGSGSFPFSIDTNFSQLVYSTSTPTLWFKSGVFASSTSYLKQLITGDGTGKATTTIENLGGVLDATAFAGSDIGAKINAAYAALPSSGGIINVPSGTYSFTTAIQFTTSGKRVLLSCAPGRSTTLNYTGTATSTVWNTTVANTNSVGDGIENCYLKGSDTTSSNALVGIELGGTNGAEGFVMRGTEVRGFGKGITLGDNTYNVDFNNVMLRINGRNFVNECVNNCGEMIRFTNSLFADTQYNGVSTDVRYCMDFTGDLATVELINSSFDDCQVYVGAGVLRMNINGGHFENPGYAGISNYDYISIATSSYNYVNVTGSMFMNSSPTPAPEFIYNGGTLQASDVTLVASGSGTALTNFVKTSNSGTGGTVQLNRIANHYNTAFGVANMVDGQYASTGSAPAILDFLSVKNHSWAGIINQDTSNNLNFYEGGSLRARIDVNGYLGIASTTPTQLLSIGSKNRGTFAVSTTTDGCWQSTKGLAWIGSCSTGSSGAPAFTPTSYGASTSTVLGLTSGLFSLSSTTLNGLKLSDLTQGYSFIGSNGLVSTVSTSTLATQIFNATTFSPNSIITTNSAGNLMATGTQLTVGNLLATSTTATSTISGSLQIGSTAGDNQLKLTASRNYPSSDSVGGQLNITGTNNLGSLATLYTNAGVGRLNDVLRIKIDNVLNDQRGLSISNDGTRSAALFDCTNATRVSGGECVTITDATGANRTTLGVSGAPVGLGLLKFVVNSGADANASALSVQIDDTDPQGFFVDTIAGYTGKFFNIRNNGTDMMTLSANGLLTTPYSSSTAYSSFLTASSTFLNAGSITLATTTAGTVKTTSGGLFYVDTSAGGGGVTSVTATYPMISSGGTTPAISIAFSTTTANIWSALNTFNGGLTIGTTTAGILRTNASGVVYASSASTTISLFNGFTNPDSTCTSTACSSIQPAQVNAPAGTYGGMVYIASSTSAKTGFYGTIDIPDNFASSSAQIKVNWTATSTASGNVVFDFDYRCVGGDNTTSLYSATFQESTTTTVANPTTGGFRKNTTLNINAGYYCSAGDTMEFFLARDGADGADTGNVDTEIYNAVIKFLTQ